ncbi:2-desacetyl-2-hydroxyethyl bacteriochlorophyllide A dehydrogenase [Lutimaribacter pacificus]|uniref:2-desacetyl-2-hydroxyethyl bacteriochlorophyllide A dehydrogenase n=1 Tax=Lutimaribacter pacificus TaxID=391948 RepID=A0A1H0M2B2_9RHOB|nr:zinc-binding dehydrogenase [Lutimaribacter pacificus]SDO74533.1 2-desacetyl-2-hydroxyethyl bacteriochlorophyllide A dehydrogenase [Lutimaribacter pacificus]SHK76924.1 2-desacetyl-2-hydroxyethyl bacteriochlorophyllide A dehydrogenase [Lutimaribacter pacificus]
MKAAVFKGPGEPLEVRDVPAPILGANEVILKVEACGICGSDLHATEQGPFLQAPGTILGHEFAGTVVASSDAAVPEGLRATAVPVNVGACVECRATGTCGKGLGILCPNRRLTGLNRDLPGAYAEYVKVDSRQVVSLPAGVSFASGALVEPLAVGLHAVNLAALTPGARVLVIGAGFIGLSVLLFAKTLGASVVVVSERSAGRRDAARAAGADDVIDPLAESDLGAAFAARAGGAPDVIFECVGAPGVIQSCIDVAAPRGTVVVVGVCLKEDTILPARAVHKELRLQFAMGYSEADFGQVLGLLDRGEIAAEELITDRVSLSDLPDAFEGLRSPDTQIKVMICSET